MKHKDLLKIADKIDSKSFYILDLEKFCATYKKLEYTFRTKYDKYQIAYSFKTNYCPAIVSAVNELGGYAEIVSDFEYEIAINAGFDKKNIIFNGPVKDLSASIDLLNHGGTVVIDNESELDALIAAKTTQTVWNVGVRCNLKMLDEKISRFGFDVYSPLFDDVLDKIQNNFNLKILHCHMGGFRELPFWEQRASEMIGIAKRLRKLPEIIDLGSGMFGEMEECFKSQFHKNVPTFDEYTDAVCRIFNDSFGKLSYEQRPCLVTEPGTTVVANALNFYCPVVSMKNIRGKDFVEVLGSVHNIGAELAPKKNLPCSLIASDNQKGKLDVQNADLVGYTCLEYDSLQRGFSGEVGIGDYFEFRNAGSYSNVIKPPFIMPNFPMIMIENGEIKIIKRKETNRDLYRTYIFKE